MTSKKIISFFLTLLTIFSVFSFSVSAEIGKTIPQSLEDISDIDLNNDGQVNLFEVKKLLKIIAKIEDIPNGFTELSFDINCDGNFSTGDARMILRLIAKLPAVPEKRTETTTKSPETTTKKTEATTKKAEATTKNPVKTTAQKMAPKYSSSNVSIRFKESAVYDFTNDQMLYAYNEKSSAYPASITKVVTAYVASLYVPMSYVCKVGSELRLMDWNSSTAGLYQGYKMTMQDLITCLLLPSGCDAAYSIAANTARYITKRSMTDTEALNYFVKLMNTTAKKLGCINSHFMNPSGFPNSNHYTCAYDLVLFARAFNQNKTLKLIGSWHYRTLKITSGQTIHLENTNYLIDSTSRYYYKPAYGMKTGTHSESGRCLLACAKKNNRELCVVILGGYDQSARYDSAISYFEYFFNRK